MEPDRKDERKTFHFAHAGPPDDRSAQSLRQPRESPWRRR